MDLTSLMDKARNIAAYTEKEEIDSSEQNGKNKKNKSKKPTRGPKFEVPADGGEFLPPIISRRSPSTPATILMIGALKGSDGKFTYIVKYSVKGSFKYYHATPEELQMAYDTVVDLAQKRKGLVEAFKEANNTHPIQFVYKSKNASEAQVWNLPPLPDEVYQNMIENVQIKKKRKRKPSNKPAKKKQKPLPKPVPKSSSSSSSSSSTSATSTNKSAFSSLRPGSDLMFAKAHRHFDRSSISEISDSDSGGLSLSDSDDDDDASSDRFSPATREWIRHAKNLLRGTQITDVMVEVGPPNIDIFVQNVQARTDVPLEKLFSQRTLRQLIHVQRYNHVADHVPGMADALREADGRKITKNVVELASSLFVCAVEDIATTFMFGVHPNPSADLSHLKPMFRSIYQKLSLVPATETPFFDLTKKDNSVEFADIVTVVRGHVQSKLVSQPKLSEWKEVFIMTYLFGLAVGFSAIPARIICEQFREAFKL